ncbi:MAG: acyltransferase [Oscillospiraceae bacterium]|nr:acyltransferase [Oscillospiraceae bacterium]
MTSFLEEEELKGLGLKAFGCHVKISRYARFYDAANISIGDNVRIDDFCILSGKISLGSHIHIAAYSALYGGTEGIEIEDFANLSSRISVYSVSDDYSGETLTNPTIPNEYKNVCSAPVHIEKHVIIGSTSVVLPGVTIREGSSFGAFSFINRDSEPWSVNAGIPFQRIRDRSKDLLDLEEEYLRRYHHEDSI